MDVSWQSERVDHRGQCGANMISLSRLQTREQIPELMDVPGVDPAEHDRALKGIARVNRITGSAEVLWPSIYELAKSRGRGLRILDVATGGGDVPARLVEKAARAGIMLDLFGCDISGTAVALAEAKCPS